MEDTKFVELIREACKTVDLVPLAILKTPRSGEVVDNGMGVDFELDPFVLIYKMNRGASRRATDIFFDDPFGDYKGSHLATYDIEHITGLDEMIQNLFEKDEYAVIWRDDTYKPREKMVSQLENTGNHLELEFHNSYALTLTFDEVKKYITDKFNPSQDTEGLFLAALQDREDFEAVVGNKWYPRDVVKFKSSAMTETGITFYFSCVNKETMWDLKEREMIDEALADVDAGRVISHENVKKMMEKLMKTIQGRYDNERFHG